MILLFASEIIAVPSASPTPPPTGDLNHCEKFHVVADLDVVKAGKIVTFSIVSENPEIQSGKFEWTVSDGQMISGQGTFTLMVQTTKEMLTKPIKLPVPSPQGNIFVGDPRRASISAKAKILFESQLGCPLATIRVSVSNRQSIATNKPADMTALELSSIQLVLPCREETVPEAGTSDSMIINVTASAHDNENDVITYHYTISGGRIIGTGEKIKWDLSDAAPGYYTITGEVDDGCGICGKTISKSVTVIGC